ncbi:hypothetical protein C8J34_11611 [Rhizobium sp. PP-F2F-G36]|nr:hypothetical protein C8J34_11611 [Rhizobium sp. PP-F2F-G36]
MAYQIMIGRIAGIETKLFVLPNRFHDDAYVLADEMQRICQRAYTMGRMDEIEATRTLIRDHRQTMVPERRGNRSRSSPPLRIPAARECAPWHRTAACALLRKAGLRSTFGTDCRWFMGKRNSTRLTQASDAHMLWQPYRRCMTWRAGP